jgi:hypothetical protein
MQNRHPELPVEALRTAARDDQGARERIDALHRELNAERPASAAIRDHVEDLRNRAPLTSLILNWYDDPRTQLFINDLILEGF